MKKENGKNGDGQDWFDFEESKRRRDEGIDRVRENNRVWFDASVLASTQLIRIGLIKPTGKHRPMRAKRSHARQTPVYQDATA
jgi:hypothetical protein